MFTKIIIWFLTSKIIVAQLNGEFWWLNGKLASLKNVNPPPPMFEDLSEFDNNENEKIIFRDDNLFSDTESIINYKKHGSVLKTSDRLLWPEEAKDSNIDNKTSSDNQSVVQNKTTEHYSEVKDDKFTFIFPDRENYVRNDNSESINTSDLSDDKQTNGPSTLVSKDAISFSINKVDDQSEPICTFLKKNDCYRKNGLVYNFRFERCYKKYLLDQLICCILPLSIDNNKAEPTEIYFPDTLPKYKNRHKRSNIDSSLALKQREALLKRKYAQARNAKPTSQTRIVTPDDDYIDPYWNIKNSNLYKPDGVDTKYEYDSEDYVEDYVVELPRPGLTGLYSDNGHEPSSWTVLVENKGTGYGNTDYDYEQDTSFGYSSIDPRLGDPSSHERGQPMKLTTSSDEITYNAESQTINYQSNPDFQVLQGFKLLNLVRNKSRDRSKISRKPTTENVVRYQNKPLMIRPADLDSGSMEDTFSENNRQLFKGCGNVVLERMERHEQDKTIGEAENGSHPWMSVLVQTEKRQNIICYATIIHPRAAITAADCVHGSAQGTITLLAGLWDLNDMVRSKSRVPSMRIHPQYKPGELAFNLAFLYWMRPLKLSTNVQPVCLSDANDQDNCKFYGWGGFDQALRPHSRWQRADILTPRACSSQISNQRVKLPSKAFCASVETRSTVTGTGGSLICERNGRHSAVGLAVWRDDVLVMLPVQEWAMRAINVLRGV